jgi:hypothetical protein
MAKQIVVAIALDHEAAAQELVENLRGAGWSLRGDDGARIAKLDRPRVAVFETDDAPLQDIVVGAQLGSI